MLFLAIEPYLELPSFTTVYWSLWQLLGFIISFDSNQQGCFCRGMLQVAQHNPSLHNRTQSVLCSFYIITYYVPEQLRGRNKYGNRT